MWFKAPLGRYKVCIEYSVVAQGTGSKGHGIGTLRDRVKAKTIEAVIATPKTGPQKTGRKSYTVDITVTDERERPIFSHNPTVNFPGYAPDKESTGTVEARIRVISIKKVENDEE